MKSLLEQSGIQESNLGSCLGPDGWIPNNDDVDDNCYSNYHDCAGVCDGDAIVQTYWNDDDGDGLGNGNSEEFCDATVPSDWVLNNGDINDDMIVDILDIVNLVNFILSGSYDSCFDVNNDNIVNILDIIIVINEILNS